MIENITKCDYYQNGNCLIAKTITELNVDCPIIHESVCETCIKRNPPRDVNDVTVSLALSALKSISMEKRALIRDKYSQSLISKIAPQYSAGVGSELHKLLLKKGWTPTNNCPCYEVLIKMNKEGPDWCIENWKWIASKMREEWRNRHSKTINVLIPSYLLDLGSHKLIIQAVKNWKNIHEKVTTLDTGKVSDNN